MRYLIRSLVVFSYHYLSADNRAIEDSGLIRTSYKIGLLQVNRNHSGC